MKNSRLVFEVLAIAALAVFAVGARAVGPTHGSVGVGHGITVPSKDGFPCDSNLHLNYDGSVENGYCWEYGGVVPGTTYGAFAECYNYIGETCGIELILTSIGNPGQPATIYIWGDAGGIPGNVIAESQVTPSDVPIWPSVGTYDYVLAGYVPGNYWTGYWADFSGGSCGYYVAADTNGFGGCPMTNIAPGIGYPTGWNNCSVVWGPTQSIGIGSWAGACGPNVRCGNDPGPCCYPDGSCQWVLSCSGYWSPTGECAPNPCNTNTSSVKGAIEGLSPVSIAAIPNPSPGQALILYRLPKAASVTLEIYDAAGAVVRRLAQGQEEGTGVHTARWDGRNAAGERLPNGTYFARVATPAGIATGKIVLSQ